MIKHFSLAVLLSLGIALPTDAAVTYYTGSLTLVTTSGSVCETFSSKTLPVSLVLKQDFFGSTPIKGYFGGDGISLGYFSGAVLDALEVRYPYSDETRAGGHRMRLSRTDSGKLTGELNDRHIENTVAECNFDVARIELIEVPAPADNHDGFDRMKQLFELGLKRDEGAAFVASNNYNNACTAYGSALELADSLWKPGARETAPLLVALSTSCAKAGRYDDLIKLHDQRSSLPMDQHTRMVLVSNKLGALFHQGRGALSKGNLELALDKFTQAYAIEPKNKEVLFAVMTVHIRRGQYTEAVAFLEQAVEKLDNEDERTEIKGVIAMVYYKKFLKDEAAGDITNAEVALNKALEMDPAEPTYVEAVAKRKHKEGKYAEALAVLDRALELNTNEDKRKSLLAAQDKLRINEMMLKKLREVTN